MKQRLVEGEVEYQGKGFELRQAVPLFILGFLGMAIMNSLGVFPLLILVALAGVGLEMDISVMKIIGLRPFYAGLCAAVFIALMSFGLISLAGIR